MDKDTLVWVGALLAQLVTAAYALGRAAVHLGKTYIAPLVADAAARTVHAANLEREVREMARTMDKRLEGIEGDLMAVRLHPAELAELRSFARELVEHAARRPPRSRSPSRGPRKNAAA